jgi:glycosyltransferase involved in cell wall biosynthesis
MPAGWRLVIVGDGPLAVQLKRAMTEKELEQSVQICGHQSDVAAILSTADIFALPSHWEGLSNTTLEAMACGLPVVSTKVSGSIELLEETGAGIIVPVGDMERFGQALVRLANDTKLRHAMGGVARRVVEERYSIETIAARHLELYSALSAISISPRGIA